MKDKFESPQCVTCTTRWTSFFCNLDSNYLEEIDNRKTSNKYKRKQVIFHEGHRPVGVFCVNEGKIKIHQLGDTGKDQIVRLAKPGEILGYRALVSGENYTASATALEDAVICFIPKEKFFEVLQSSTNMSMKLVELLSSDLKTAEQKITQLAQKTVRERLAETLLILKESFGVEKDGNTLTVQLTREEIANIVGTATESIIRILADYKEENIIGFEGKKMIILKPDELVRIANIYD